MKLSFRILFILFFAKGYAQQGQSSSSSSRMYYSDDPLMNIIMERSGSADANYKTDFLYSTYNLHLYKDSTFVFYYVDEQTYLMACGKYRKDAELFVLQSDSITTSKAVIDPAFYKKYFKFKSPTAFKIKSAAYFLDGDLLIPFHNSSGKEKVRLLFSSKELLTIGLEMSVYKSIHYNLSGNRIVINYGVDEDAVRIDSLWGFVTFKKGILEAYRVTPKGFNWYGTPGIEIVQTDPFVIYTVGKGPNYSYFSRELNSKIYPLTLDNLKKEFKENTDFIERITKDFGPHKALFKKGSTKGSYRVLEIYKESVTQNKSEG